MDQLKVILEHRFWVLSALAVLLPPIGWWVTTGDMATKTDKRTKDIEKQVKTLQSLNKGLSTVANKDWIKSVEDVNVKLAGRVAETHKQLYEHQLPAMVWWPLIRKPLEESKVKHRGENPANPKAFNDAKRLFMSRYSEMWEKDVFKVVEPFDMVTGDGKVLCSEPNVGVQILRARDDVWQQRQNISAQEMWDAQEDLWMLHALMKAIARVNEGSINIDDARIKKLISATLRGGSPTDLADRRKKKESKTGAPGAPGAPAGGKMLGGLSGLGGGSGRGGEGDYGAKELPMLESDEVFGSSDEAVVSSQGSKKSLSAGDVSAGNAWFKTDQGGKWRARGFVLRLVMDHQEVPKLLTVLTEGPFPVEILQVEHKRYEFKRNRQTAVGGLENEADQKKIKAAEERVSLAMNQSNLAEVMVAGVFIFYNEPSSPAAPGTVAPGTPAAPANASNAAKAVPAVPIPPATGKSTQPAPTPAASSPKNPPTGKVVNPGGASATAPKATSTVPATGPTTPKPVQPVK